MSKKSVLLSIKPKYCELIASGKKTVEIRKTRPKIDVPFKCYIYCTLNGTSEIPMEEYFNGKWHKKKGKVIGEFVCDNIECFDVPYPAFQNELEKRFIEQSCMSYYDLHRYAYHDVLYAWHISNLVIYDEPKELSRFTLPCPREHREYKRCSSCKRHQYIHSYDGTRIYDYCHNEIKRPPQSWYYVEGKNDVKEV